MGKASFYCKLRFNLTEAFDDLDDSTVAAITRAILHYSQGQPLPEIPPNGRVIWSMVKSDLDLDFRDIENGLTGGRPKKPPINPL